MPYTKEQLREDLAKRIKTQQAIIDEIDNIEGKLNWAIEELEEQRKSLCYLTEWIEKEQKHLEQIETNVFFDEKDE